MSRKIGSVAEQQACDYLMAQGLKWVESNYQCRVGEIDLIMRDKNCLVFIEVRARVSNAFGGALASVTYNKKQKLIKTATLFLLTEKFHDKQPIRFDVLSIQGKPPIITWIKNAFGTDF